jgi:hypothetical protein
LLGYLLLNSGHTLIRSRCFSSFLFPVDQIEELFGGAPIHDFQGLQEVEQRIGRIPALAITGQRASNILTLKKITSDYTTGITFL